MVRQRKEDITLTLLDINTSVVAAAAHIIVIMTTQYEKVYDSFSVNQFPLVSLV